MAIERSARIARGRGEGVLVKLATPYLLPREGQDRRFVRQRSTVDFVGTVGGRAVAFDCKVTRQHSLPHKNVHQHQLDWLQDFAQAGGLAGLILGYEDYGVWLASIEWYLDYRQHVPRKSLPAPSVATAAESSCMAWKVVRGGRSYPLDWVQAFRRYGEALELGVDHGR